MKTCCMRYVISGKVQGVWYRASAQKQALELGLTGWVRNLADGRVELLACGPENQLKKLQSWLWQGPRLARVEQIEAQEQAWQHFDDFSIR